MMWKICRFEQPKEPAQDHSLAGYLHENIEGERSVAMQLIEQHVRKYDHKGWNEEQDHWWCWNDGDAAITILTICGSAPRREGSLS
jgi:hypothetical protein